MASTTTTIYDQLEQQATTGDAGSALTSLVSHLEENQQYHELFEALKMQLRHQLGLPVAQADQQEKFSEEIEQQLEQGLLDACRRVAAALFAQGKVREGWMYMRPVGDREEAAVALRNVAPTDDNFDELLEVLVHEGVDVGRGYALALERLGTCNSITLFESALASRPRADQQVAARLLVDHVHAELVENISADIQRRENSADAKGQFENQTAESLLEERPELLRDGAYHLDTSHLASTVRFARVLDNPEQLGKALDIAIYGRQLHPQFQYPGEEPFLDLYPASIAFFRALLGQQVDAGIRYFSQKADSVSQNDFGAVAVEVLIDLLSRCGRHDEAIEAYAKRLSPESRLLGIAPSLLQLSQRSGKYKRAQEISRERDDLLGFTAALLRDA